MVALHRRYSEAFKRRVLAAYEKRTVSTTALAAKFKIKPQIIWAWQRAYKPGAVPSKSKTYPSKRTAIAKRGVFGLLAFAADELGKTHPNVDVARAYIVLARHELAEKDKG